ncbi:MAG: glycosyltransferase, partial [Alphaproteobacteria bacterium]
KVEPDLLVTYNWGAIEWALVNRLRRHIPHLHMESGFGPEEADRQIRRRVLLRRFALAKTRHVIVPSLDLLEIARDTWRLPEERVMYVPNGVDLDRFAAPPDRSLLPAGWSGMPIVGTVAPMRPEKNLGRLVRAFAAVAVARDTRLLLVGDGPERPALESLVAQLGVADRVHFAGY